MADYSFLSRRRVYASPEIIWHALIDSEIIPTWWKSILRVDTIAAGNANGIGRTALTMWKTFLPYGFTFDTRTTDIDWQRTLALDAFGELEGTGWTLSGEGYTTRVQSDWNVQTTQAWMNFIAPTKPFFVWNHDAVMNDRAGWLDEIAEPKN